MQSRKEYLAGLHRRRLAAGAVIRDEQGRICLVEPTYKTLWNLPGGTVERDESPATGCRREVREELGLDLPIGQLLCLDWVAPDGDVDPHGALILCYDGGVVDQQTIARIITPAEELHGFRFVPVDELDDYVSAANRDRITASLAALGGPPVELHRD